MNSIEEDIDLQLDFHKLAKASKSSRPIIPVAVQNIDTGEVILLAYTDEEAFKKCIMERRLILWSTSRNEIWEKGKTSGNTFELIEAYVNCDQNSLLYRVKQKHGGICHTRNKAGKPRNCFYRRINLNRLTLENINP